MRVFNLTKKDLHFMGRVIPANGGSVELDMEYIPDRDLKLQENKVLAFGELPAWWKLQKEVELAEQVKKAKAAQVASKPIQVTKFEPKEDAEEAAAPPPAAKEVKRR